VQYSAITSWARLIWEALRTYQIDGDEVFREVGLDPAALEDPNGRYPVTGMVRLWELARERSGDPCFGLTAATQWRPTTWHGLGFAWLASGTLEQAYRRLERYSAIFTTAANIRLTERSDDFCLTVATQHDISAEPVGAVIDAFVSIVIHMSRVVYGPDFRPLGVELIHEGSGCRQKRREFFGSPVEYQATQNALTVSKHVVRRALASGNAELAHANERVIKDYLAQIGGGPTAMQVRAQIIRDLSSGAVRAETVAAELNMSSRTLQRRLHDEGASYTTVLDDTRRELARRLIEEQTMTLSEISYLLGFSEVSSFSRSFRRWMGQSPTDYRIRC
jgi:AraC-like DNA-binding protein